MNLALNIILETLGVELKEEFDVVINNTLMTHKRRMNTTGLEYHSKVDNKWKSLEQKEELYDILSGEIGIIRRKNDK